YWNLLLHQCSCLVARERVRVFQSSYRFADQHCSLPARSDAPRSVLRFHGTYAAINLADRDQSERHGLSLLHADISDVRRHLRDVVAVQGAPLRAAPLESAAAVEGDERFIFFCLSPRKVPPASEPSHARQVLPLTQRRERGQAQFDCKPELIAAELTV